MKKLIMVSMGLVVLLFTATSSASAAPPISASGEFDVAINALQPTPKANYCLLEVDSTLNFRGTLEGAADGNITVLVFASCEEVFEHPLGTFREVFSAELEFIGTVDGEPATADIALQGRAAEGGEVRATMRLSDGLQGVLRAEGVASVGGSYSGLIKVK